MTRRSWAAALLPSSLLAQKLVTVKPIQPITPDPDLQPCDHAYVAGPYYIQVAVSYEEPKYYPPNGIVKVEHCTKCGQLRLPKEDRKYVGPNLAAGEKS